MPTRSLHARGAGAAGDRQAGLFRRFFRRSAARHPFHRDADYTLEWTCPVASHSSHTHNGPMFERYSHRARCLIFMALWSARRRSGLYIEPDAATAGARMGMRGGRKAAASIDLQWRGGVLLDLRPGEARDRVSPRRRLQPVRPGAPPDRRASSRRTRCGRGAAPSRAQCAPGASRSRRPVRHPPPVVRRRDRRRADGDARKASVAMSAGANFTGMPTHSLYARGAVAPADNFRLPRLGCITCFSPPVPAPAARRPSLRPAAGGWGCARHGRCRASMGLHARSAVARAILAGGRAEGPVSMIGAGRSVRSTPWRVAPGDTIRLAEVGRRASSRRMRCGRGQRRAACGVHPAHSEPASPSRRPQSVPRPPACGWGCAVGGRRAYRWFAWRRSVDAHRRGSAGFVTVGRGFRNRNGEGVPCAVPAILRVADDPPGGSCGHHIPPRNCEHGRRGDCPPLGSAENQLLL